MASDDELLDEVFSRFVQDLSDGRDIDLSTVHPERPDLADSIRETYELASRVVVRRPSRPPGVAGYRIVSELGRGGMGTVYLAEPDDGGSRVALKALPSRRLQGSHARSRFEREARAVSTLSHPGIVPVLSVGEDDGTPWFTMPFLEGQTLAQALHRMRTEHPATGPLPDGALAQAAGVSAEAWHAPHAQVAAHVVRDIAAALAHAHARGVVHRDVKPSNMMISPDGSVRLFDFGLATLESDDVLTRTGDFLGTPQYASPEQIRGEVADVGPATDIYALGVTLFQLLTQRLPFDGPTTQSVLEQVLRQEPPRPRTLERTIPQDLEAVCLTALEKDPARRYRSAEAMRADLDRYLTGKRVEARAPGLTRRLGRTIVRNKAVSAAVGLGLVLLVGVPTAMYAQARQANEEIRSALDDARRSQAAAEDAEAKALAERDRAQAMHGFLEKTFSAIQPTQRGSSARVVDLLAGLGRRIERELGDKPEIAASLHFTVGSSYLHISELSRAEPHLVAARDLHHERHGADHPDTIRADVWLGVLRHRQGDTKTGSELVREAYERARTALGAAHRRTLLLVVPYASLLQEDRLATQAIAHLAEAEDAARQSLGTDHTTTWRIRVKHGEALSRAGKANEGIARLEALHADQTAARGASSAWAIETAVILGEAYHRARRRKDARRLYDAARQHAAERYGPTSQMVLRIANNLAVLAVQDRDYVLGEAMHREIHRIREAKLGPEHVMTIQALFNIGGTIWRQGRLEESLAIMERVEAWRSQHLGEGHPHTLRVRSDMGFLLRRLERYEEAERMLLDVLARREGGRTPAAREAWRGTLRSLAWVYKHWGREAEYRAYEQRYQEAKAAAEAAPGGEGKGR